MDTTDSEIRRLSIIDANNVESYKNHEPEEGSGQGKDEKWRDKAQRSLGPSDKEKSTGISIQHWGRG